MILRQGTQAIVPVGPFRDVTDDATPEAGITLGAADQAELLKVGGVATVDLSGATWAAITGCDGWYHLTLTTSHTDTVGPLIVVVQDVSECRPVWARFQVIEEVVYDSIYAASAMGFSTTEADLTKLSTTMRTLALKGWAVSSF